VLRGGHRPRPRFALAHFALADLLFYAVQFGLTASPEAAVRARDALARSLELDDGWARPTVCSGCSAASWIRLARFGGGLSARLRAEPGAASLLSNHAWLHLVPRLRLAQALDEAQQASRWTLSRPSCMGGWASCEWRPASTGSRWRPAAGPSSWPRLGGCTGSTRPRSSRREAGRGAAAGAQGLRAGSPTADRRRDVALLGPVSSPEGGEGAPRRLEAMACTGYVPPSAFAMAYIGLGGRPRFRVAGEGDRRAGSDRHHLPSMPLYDGLRATRGSRISWPGCTSRDWRRARQPTPSSKLGGEPPAARGGGPRGQAS